MKRFLLSYAIEILSEMRSVSDFRASKVFTSLIKDLNYIQSKRLVPVAIVMDSKSLSFLLEKDKWRVTKINRFYWRQLPIYIDHSASFRADVVGEPENDIENEKEYVYNSVRTMIRQGATKEEIHDLIDDCFLDDLFA